jgi:hypothetical protein
MTEFSEGDHVLVPGHPFPTFQTIVGTVTWVHEDEDAVGVSFPDPSGGYSHNYFRTSELGLVKADEKEGAE